MGITPIEKRGNLFVKRDDLFCVGGASGGKARACQRIAVGASGLTTACSRISPQSCIVARVARVMGIGCRVHTATGQLTGELMDAVANGAEIVQWAPGYTGVISARARMDGAERGWVYVPFGMECVDAVVSTRSQVVDIPREVKRIVIPVGSGMSAAGILWGLGDCGSAVLVLGVSVGASPISRLDKYAPPMWRCRMRLVKSSTKYNDSVEASVNGLVLDPYYEAKCVQFLEEGDLLWVVGIRATVASGNS